jgi:hypothetical protein
MTQYINKNEVENILRNLWKKDDGNNSEHRICYNKALEEVQCELDTLEVKEVGNVWHDAGETPKGAGDKEILVQFADFHASVHEIDDWEYLDHQTKWAYLKDLT